MLAKIGHVLWHPRLPCKSTGMFGRLLLANSALEREAKSTILIYCKVKLRDSYDVATLEIIFTTIKNTDI